MKKLVIIDTFGFLFKSYHALLRVNLQSKNGFPTGMLTGFLNFIKTIEADVGSDYLLFALDSKGNNFRHEMYDLYKANRKEADEDLKVQLPVAIEMLKKMGFFTIEKPGYEADDVIASTVKYAKNHSDLEIVVASHDKDLYQLIDERVCIFNPTTKMILREKECIDKFGVEPKYVVDWLAIVGDASDNIPGVRGIGAKGASKLINEFGEVENIYKNLSNITNARSRVLLEDSKENAYLSKKLASLHYGAIDGLNLEDLSVPVNPFQNIEELLKEYDLTSFLKYRMNVVDNNYEKKEELAPKEEIKTNYILLDTNEKLDEAVSKITSKVAFDTETTSLDTQKAKIVGFSFSYKENEAYYVPIAHNYLGVGNQIDLQKAKEVIQKIFTYDVIGHNIKYDLEVLKTNFDLTFNKFQDTMILFWLLNPSARVGMDNLAKIYLGIDTVKFKETVKKGETFASVLLSDACEYAAQDADITLKLYNKIENLLDMELWNLAKETEFEFINTLVRMEMEGIKLDSKYLQNIEVDFNSKLEVLTSKIYELCDETFNINSPKQLGVILFEKMGLKAGKKTKTGYSTDESVLSELADENEVARVLLEYRSVYKLLSTYIKPLQEHANKSENKRVHTSFLHSGTATGRLSSKEPNLQNIPTRSDDGKKIREAFIARDGYKLVSIDYSQIELRLLAHFSEDKELLQSFKEDKDIHLQTAIKLFGDEAKEKRSVAKSINFGLLYGMGSRKLAKELGISVKEAKSYMDSYFDAFSSVKNHMEDIKNETKKNGFVTTLLGRKRYFDFANANERFIASYERECVNTKFQGSAADIIKLAMIEVDRSFVRDEVCILLQIHDELILEIREDKLDLTSDIVKIMENVVNLNVPLKTSLSIGDNWGELK